MTSATVNQFNLLFPATATPSRLSSGKVPFTLKLENDWERNTLNGLTKLVDKFGVSGSHLHLSKVEDGCTAVTWLCSTTEVKQLKMGVSEATISLRTMGMLQVFIGEEKLVLEYSATGAFEYVHAHRLLLRFFSSVAVKGSSDLILSCGVQQSELTVFSHDRSMIHFKYNHFIIIYNFYYYIQCTN